MVSPVRCCPVLSMGYGPVGKTRARDSPGIHGIHYPECHVLTARVFPSPLVSTIGEAR